MKNPRIDILRAISILWIVLHHCWSGIEYKNIFLDFFVRFGGEIGVTIFFALSGYGCWHSLQNMENRGELSYKKFLLKRFKRILPGYWSALLLCLLIGEGAVYIKSDRFWDIIAHIFLIHNLFPDSFGSINGAMWTMGVIFQFYFIAYVVYKCLKKYGLIVAPVSIIITCVTKLFVYRYILPYIGHSDDWGFWTGRQLITALDNFVIGSTVAWWATKKSQFKFGVKLAICGISACLIIVFIICRIGIIYNGIHTNNWMGYTWHSAIAVCVGVTMILLHYNGKERRNILSSCFLWISKYEYSIYLLHLVIIKNIKDKSEFINNMSIRYPVLTYLLMFLVVIYGGGYFMDNFFNHNKFSEILNEKVQR